MRRGSPLAPARRKQRPRIPDAVRAEVRQRTNGRCFLCLYLSGGRGGRRIAHIHHVFPKRATLFPELAVEPWNLLGICEAHHMAHEFPGVNPTRIPRAALPLETIALADGHGRREAYLERTYPLTAPGGTGQ